MKIRDTLRFEQRKGRLLPTFQREQGRSYVESASALVSLRGGDFVLGGAQGIQREFSDMCMARCTVYCIIALVILSRISQLGTTPIATLMCAICGLIFIVLILRTLDAKVNGFTDRNGIEVSFTEFAITFADGTKVQFSKD